MSISRLGHILLLTILIIPLLIVTPSLAAPSAQTQSSEELAGALLETLTPEERVGQLFVVDFEGNSITQGSQLYNLITQYHVGGVNFKAENNNIPQGEDSLLQMWLLIQEIQRTEITNSQETTQNNNTGETISPAQIPLFIAIQQNGDGFPTNQILSDLSPLPSEMAIGATWSTDLAQSAGEVLGQELSSLGFNLLLGPSLNVHSSPRPELTGDLGVTSFSGSPFWVGEFGKAFISGVHEGSNNRLGVFSLNFPGFTGGELPLDEEIPTVRKTIDQLLLTELPPFFAVTDLAADSSDITDGLLLTHARYQAFQSSITTSTPPLTLDPQALTQLLSLQEISTWHANGGLILSDELGSQAIRRYYTQIGQTYDPKLVSRDALLAGNDLILTGNFTADNSPDLYTSIVNTLDFFAQKYRDDVAFAEEVDDAVLRILTEKFELYNNSFDEGNIIIPSSQLENIAASNQLTFEIARQAATLINPEPGNLNNVLPNPPGVSDFITIITDTKEVKPCNQCTAMQSPSVRALELVIERLYGPSGDGLVFPGNIVSYSYAELITALNQVDEGDDQILTNIAGSDWLVFLQTDLDPDRPSSYALSEFLSEAPELTQDKKIVVFSLNAPYYLSATEISAVTAYYSLYSKQPGFIEVAARLLFKELNAPGASPVTVTSVGYILDQALAPDPSLVFPLEVILNENISGSAQQTLTPTPPIYTQGDSLILRSGPILDYNGHSVPDSTLVTFTLINTNLEGISSQRDLTSLTVNGYASTNFILDSAGTLRVQASSGQPPAISNEYVMDVAGLPNAIPTDEDEPTPIVITPTPQETEPAILPEPPRDVNNLVDWVLSLIVIAFVSLFAYQFGAMAGTIRWGVRWALTTLIGGLLVNAYISFNLPGANLLVSEYHIWGIVLAVGGGCLIGWAAGLIWRWMKR